MKDRAKAGAPPHIRPARLAAKVVEEDEPSKNGQYRKREETDSAVIWGHFLLTAVRIGHLVQYSAFSLLNGLRRQDLLSQPDADSRH